MANKIKPKRSFTSALVPTGLQAYEFAINGASPAKMWIGAANGLSSVLVSSMAIADHTGTTDNLTQGSTNKFYADSLARLALSSTATGLTYTNTTGVFSLTSGYAIPTTTKQTQWDTAYSSYLQWDGGATNLVAATARTSLGLVIGTNVQAWDGDLGAIAAIAGTTGILKKTAANTWSLDTTAYTANTGTVTSVSASVPTGLSISGSPITTAGTLAITLTAGYSIPTTASQTTWDTAYTNRITSLTTTGSTGAATLTSNVLNIPNHTLAGLGGQALATNLTSLAGLTYVSASFLKMSAAGTFALDTSTYLTGNQNITLSGDVSGSGSTAITTTLATVSIAKGGTGQTTANAGLNALLPSQTSNSGKYLTSNGTNTSWGAVTGGPSFTASATAPASPASGDRWYDTSTGSYLIYFSDGTSSQWVETSNSGMVSNPTGTIIPFAGANAPSGFLLCNGSSVSSSDYLALHAVISNTYGGSAYSGAAALNFTLPDYRGRVLIGAGTGSGLTARTLGGTVGAESHTVSSSNISQFSTGNAGSHTHSFSKEVLTYLGSGGNRYDPYPGSVWAGHIAAGLTLDTKPDHTHTVGTASPTAISNLQPSIGVNYLIKT